MAILDRSGASWLNTTKVAPSAAKDVTVSISTAGKYVDKNIDIIVAKVDLDTAKQVTGTGTCAITGGIVTATGGTAEANVAQTGMADGITTTETAYYVTATASATGGNAKITDVKDAHTAGYIETKTATTAIAGDEKTGDNASKTEKIYLKESTLSNSGTEGVNYTENTSVIIPSEGALYISAGYMPNTKITLDQMLEGNDDSAATANDDLLAGKIAYDVDGKKLTGTIQTKTNTDLTSTANGATVTTTVPAGYYATEATSSATVKDGTAKVNDGQNITVTGDGTPTLNATSGKYEIAVSGNKDITGSAESGWVTAVTAANVSASGKAEVVAGTITPNVAPQGTAVDTISAGGQIKISAGYYPNDVYYAAQSADATSAAKLGASGTAANTVTSVDVTIGAYDSATNTVAITGTKAITGTANASVTTAGYAAGTLTGTGSVTGNTTINMALNAFDGTYTVA